MSCKERRRQRALERGYLSVVPPGFVHIQVPSELEGRLRAQLKAMMLHQSCNKETQCAHHLLAKAIQAARPFHDESFCKKAFRIKQAADGARHDWHSDFVDGARDLGSASGVSDTEVVQSSTGAVRRNRWSSKSSLGLSLPVECEKELPGSSVLIYDEEFFRCLDTVGNDGIVEGGSKQLHGFDDKSEENSFFDGDENSFGDFQSSYPHIPGGSSTLHGRWADCWSSDGSDEAESHEQQVHVDSELHEQEALLENENEKIEENAAFHDISDEHTRGLQAVSDSCDPVVFGPDPVSFGRVPQDENEKVGKNTFFSEEPDENKDNGALIVDLDENKATDIQIKPGIWEHRHVESLVSAPWRRRYSMGTSVGAYDLTLLDSSDDSLLEHSAPPGVFDFTAKPGFGIRSLVLDGEDPGDALHDDTLHEEDEAVHNPEFHGGSHKDREPFPAGVIPGTISSRSNPVQGELHEHGLHDNVDEHDAPVQNMLGESHGEEELHVHSHSRTGFIYMLADPDRELMVHCTNFDTVRQLANFALNLAYQAAMKNRIEHSSNLWKSRAHQERDAKLALQRELDSSIKNMIGNTYNALEDFNTILGSPFTSAVLRQQDIQEAFDMLFDDCEKELSKGDAHRATNKELQASLADMNTLQATNEELQATVDNLKALNIRLMKDIRRIQKEALENEAEMCFDTGDESDSVDATIAFEDDKTQPHTRTLAPAANQYYEDKDRSLADFLQAASAQTKMKRYCFRVQRDGHLQETRTREGIRQILRDSISDESVVQRAEAQLWQMSTSITDYTTRALVLAAQSSSIAAESEDLATSSFGNESSESKVHKISKNSGSFGTSGIPRRARRGGKGKKDKKGRKSSEIGRCTESPSSAHSPTCEPIGPPQTYRTYDTCEPHGPPQPPTDQLNQQQEGTFGRCTESPSSAHLPTCEPIGPPQTYEKSETCEPRGPPQSPPDQLNQQQKGTSNYLDSSNEMKAGIFRHSDEEWS